MSRFAISRHRPLSAAVLLPASLLSRYVPMSAATPSAAGKGERVSLHVYEPAKSSGPSIPGFGVYHTGIELCGSGVEWCYAGGPEATGSGVQQQRARESPDSNVWKYRETVELGLTSKSAAQCSQLMREVQSEYAARDYDIVHHNCNHFTADIAKRLGVKYPSHINRAAAFGAFFLDNPIKDRQRKVNYTQCNTTQQPHSLPPAGLSVSTEVSGMSVCVCAAVMLRCNRRLSGRRRRRGGRMSLRTPPATRCCRPKTPPPLDQHQRPPARSVRPAPIVQVAVQPVRTHRAGGPTLGQTHILTHTCTQCGQHHSSSHRCPVA